MVNKISRKLIVLLVLLPFIGMVSFSSYANEKMDEDEWIEIRRAEELYSIRNNKSGKYKLMNDIDLTEVTSQGGIFDYEGKGWRITDFSGEFDGQGYTIKGMRLSRSEFYVGFFSENYGQIRNVCFSNFDISVEGYSKQNGDGTRSVGTVVGSNHGVVENIVLKDCEIKIYNNNSNMFIGGVCGYNGLEVSGCYSNTKFEFISMIGGELILSGISGSSSSDGRVEKCVCVGNVINWPDSYTQGCCFCGISYGDCSIIDSYFVSNERIGNIGFFGELGGWIRNNSLIEYGEVKTSYFFTPTDNSVYLKSGDKITLNQSQMQAQMFFEGFDFENTWWISDKTEYKCPMLRNTYNGDVKSELTPDLSIDGWTYGEEANSPVLVGNTGEGSVVFEYKKKDAADDSYSETIPTDAGDYTLKATIEETEYYKESVVTCDFKIEKQDVSIFGITAKSKVYDGTTNAALDCSLAYFTGLVGKDLVSVIGTGSFENKNAGTDKDVLINTLQLNGEKAGNYKISDSSFQSTIKANISKKVVTVKSDDISKKYGSEDPSLTYSVEGLVAGESASSVASGCLKREVGENVGSYLINQGTLSFGENYIISFSGATFTIEKAEGSQTKPSAPSLINRTETSISVKVLEGYEYSIDAGEKWNATGVFENLKGNTVYSIVARKAETSNEYAGTVSDALVIRTLEHQHSYIESILKEASCTEIGTKKFECACGDIYLEGIPALGHNYVEIENTAVEPTCLDAGKEADRKCLNCNEIIIGETIEATGHSWDDGVITKEPSCVGTGVRTYTCSVCETTKTEKIKAKGHTIVIENAVAPTCTRIGLTQGSYCSVCNAVLEEPEEAAALGHDYREVEGTAVEATCTVDGKEADKKCSRCNDVIEGGVIKAKGHTEVTIPAVAATCTEKGSTEGKKCSVCNTVLVEPEEVATLGHDYKVVSGTAVEATCTAAGKEADKKCSRCDDVIEGGVIKAKGHTEVTIPAVAATCTEKGSTEGKKCSVCNTVLEEPEEVAAFGHDYQEVEGTAVEATCTAAGKEADKKCSRCDDVIEGGAIKAKGHTEVTIPAVSATCTENGSTEGKKCSVCNTVLEEPEEVAALGHDYQEVEGTAVEATCTAAGKEADKKCSRCDDVIEGAVIKATGHTEVIDRAVEATISSTGLTEGSHCSVCGEAIKKQNIIPILKKEDTNSQGNAGSETDNKSGNDEMNKNNATNSNSANSNSKNNPSGSSSSVLPKYSNEWVNGKWYDVNGNQTYSGTLLWKGNSTGWWIEDSAGWYPTDSWQKVDGKWYYFKLDGYMASNEYYNGYWFNSDGTMDETYYLTWKNNSTGWWVEDKSGWWPSSRWLKIDGCWYYFDGSGYMVTSQYVDGYWIGSDGVCQ